MRVVGALCRLAILSFLLVMFGASSAPAQDPVLTAAVNEVGPATTWEPLYPVATSHVIAHEDRVAAYERAVECLAKEGKTPAMAFSDIRWAVAQDSVRVPTPDGRGKTLVRGYFDSADNTLWVVRGAERDVNLLTHETLHAIGVLGHPKLFRRCGAA